MSERATTTDNGDESATDRPTDRHGALPTAPNRRPRPGSSPADLFRFLRQTGGRAVREHSVARPRPSGDRPRRTKRERARNHGLPGSGRRESERASERVSGREGGGHGTATA